VLSTAYIFDEHGFTLTGTRPALQFVAGSPAPQIAADKVLACYVTTPEDYVSSRVPREHDDKQK
jgi:5-deoxy-D-glucuronate isomerase